MGELTRKKLRVLGKILKDDLRKQINEKDLKASNKLSKGIKYRTTERKHATVLSVYLPFYAEFLNDGTTGVKKGKKGSKDLFNAILKWAKIKNITPRYKKSNKERAMKDMAYLISRKIAKDGIVKRFNGGSKFIDIVLKDISPQVLEEIAKTKRQEILNEIE
jgi:hypothetical protein